MRDGDDHHSIGDLDYAKARLTEGLKRCRALVRECRHKLIQVRNRGEGDKPLFRWTDRPGGGSGD